MKGLHAADYAIFILFLLVSSGIGLYYVVTGGRQRTTAEFVMGNRRLGVLPIMLSLCMSSVSASYVMVFSAEIYRFGLNFSLWSLIATLVGILLVQQIVVVWLFPLKLTSAYEYFNRRFKSQVVHKTASFLGVLCSIIYIGVSMLAPSLALEAVTGVPGFVSIPLMAAIATIYTALGGMKAVIWTDVLQGSILLTGIFVVLIKTWILIGPKQAYEIAKSGGRLVMINGDSDPRVRHSTLGLILSFGHKLYLFGLQQSSVQRFSAVPSLAKARIVYFLCLIFFILLNTFIGVVGANIYSYFTLVGCDPIRGGSITKADQIFPYFVKVVSGDMKGFIGFLLAILYSGALSTVSSCLSGCAANAWQDTLKFCLPNLTDFQATAVNKVLVIFFGVIGMGATLLFTVMPTTLVRLVVGLMGVTGSPILGMFLLGGLSRRTTYHGVVAGGLTAFIFLLWLIMGSQINGVRSKNTPPVMVPVDSCLSNLTSSFISSALSNSTELDDKRKERGGTMNLYMVSYLWYFPIGVTLALITGTAVSVTARYMKPSLCTVEVDEKCLINWRKVFSLALDPYASTSEKMEIDLPDPEEQQKMMQSNNTRPET